MLRYQDGCGQPLAVILIHVQGGRCWACAGFLLGSRQTLLETKDGGKSWAKRDISAAKEEGFNFRFTSISFQVGPTPSAAGMQVRCPAAAQQHLAQQWALIHQCICMLKIWSKYGKACEYVSYSISLSVPLCVPRYADRSGLMSGATCCTAPCMDNRTLCRPA